MKLYIAKWPNGTISILNASSKKDLFFKLDEEGDPNEAEITCLNFEDSIHIITEFKKNENGIVEIVDDVHPELNWDLGETSIDADAKMISFA
jgi:hypothetical protein